MYTKIINLLVYKSLCSSYDIISVAPKTLLNAITVNRRTKLKQTVTNKLTMTTFWRVQKFF